MASPSGGALLFWERMRLGTGMPGCKKAHAKLARFFRSLRELR